MKEKVKLLRPAVVCFVVLLIILLLSACGGSGGNEPDEGTQPAADTGAPVIVTQPEDVIVSYPEGASFSIEVDHPELVASYQWIEVDQVGNEFVLNGSSAHTDTLVVPSTQGLNAELDYYCVVTGTDGSETASEPGRLDIDNRGVSKPVFYVGEYAVEPGETLDLSTVDIGDGYTLGSGTVAYDANGTDITITDLDFDNSHSMCDILCGPNVGISLVFDHPDEEEYTVTFVGENRIMNTYFDPDYNASGIPVDFYFVGTEEPPLVNLVGDGSLTVTNGSYAIRNTGDMFIDMDITVAQTLENYGDGIVAEHIMVAEGNTLDLTVYGSAINAGGNLFIQNADVTAHAHAPHISMGIATKNILQAGGDLVLDGANVSIDTSANPEICSHVAGLTGLNADNTVYISNGSTVSYSASVNEGDELYASQFLGISGIAVEIEDSTMDITIDCPYIFSVMGIYTEEGLTVLNSELDVNVRTSGVVNGIAPEGELNVNESAINVTAGTYDYYADLGESACYGTLCGTAVIRITDPAIRFSSTAEGGLAFGCNLDNIQDDPAEYEEGYQATKIDLQGCAVQTPANAVAAPGNVPQGDDSYRYYITVETYYDVQDISAPASEVVIGA